MASSLQSLPLCSHSLLHLLIIRTYVIAVGPPGSSRIIFHLSTFAKSLSPSLGIIFQLTLEGLKSEARLIIPLHTLFLASFTLSKSISLISRVKIPGQKTRAIALNPRVNAYSRGRCLCPPPAGEESKTQDGPPARLSCPTIAREEASPKQR